MYRSVRLRVAAAFAAMVCLLFSQLAVAAFACPARLDAAVAAAAVLAPGPTPLMGADHGEDHCSSDDAVHTGLCLAHCNPAKLSLNHPLPDAPPLLLVALQPLADLCEPALLAAAVPQFDVPLRSQSPPHSILHCCFRI